jgi:hypothetical protein
MNVLLRTKMFFSIDNFYFHFFACLQEIVAESNCGREPFAQAVPRGERKGHGAHLVSVAPAHVEQCAPALGAVVPYLERRAIMSRRLHTGGKSFYEYFFRHAADEGR